MNLIRKHYRLILFFTFFLSFLLHYHVFNLDLLGIHVWRQTETQTVINNFYREDFNILNPRINGCYTADRIHRMEVPIMQWIFALFYKLFGPHIIISRILSFVIGLASVYGMFYFCEQIFKNKAIAVLGAWCFSFSPVFYYYSLNPLPDNFALSCGIWSVGLFYGYINYGKIKYVIGSAVFLSLATMAKLPYVLFGTFVLSFMVMLLLRQPKGLARVCKLSLIYIICIIPALAWYIAVIPGWVIGAVYGVFDQKKNHPDLFNVLTGTVVSVLPELLINYASVLFFIAGFYLMFKRKLFRRPYFIPFSVLGCTLIFYFLYEMNIIDLVHDYYLMLFLPLIFVIVAYGASILLMSKKTGLRIIALTCLAVLPVTAYLRADPRWDTKDPGFNPAYLKYKTELRALTPENALCVAGYDDSHFILLYYIDRKGWAFDKKWFDKDLLSYFMSQGARYIYLDGGADSLPGVKDHLGEKLFDKETLRVYKLK